MPSQGRMPGVALADIAQLFILSASVFAWSLPAVMSPGPVLIATVADSSRRGFLTGPLISLGHALVEVPLILVLALGLGLVMSLGAVQGIVGLVGGAFLLVISLDFLRYARSASPSIKTDERGLGLLRYGPVAAGALTSASSPFFFIWWIGTGSPLTLEALQLSGWLGMLIFIPSHLFADLLWYSGVALAVGRGKKLMSDRAYKVIFIICGLFLLYKSLDYIAAGYAALAGHV
ncbi:MAG: LysE family transporter [Candidatus Bathyarchaeia archaeon]